MIGTHGHVRYTCDHCQHSARMPAWPTDSPTDIADRAAEAHAIAQPYCHAEFGADGLRLAPDDTPPLFAP